MADLDPLVDDIDVDAALDQVVARHRRDTRRSRQQRLAVVTACAAALVLLTWALVRNPAGEQSLDVAGEATSMPEPVVEPTLVEPVETVEPVEPAAPRCSTTPERIAAARDAIARSPMLAAMDRSLPKSLGELLRAGRTASVGTVVAVREDVSEPPPEDGWPTAAETGVTIQYAGAVLTISTPDGTFDAPVVLAMSGSAGIETMRPGLRTADILALDGACVVVTYPVPGTVTDWDRPTIVALASGPGVAPLALDPWHDVVVDGYANPDELVAALLGGS